MGKGKSLKVPPQVSKGLKPLTKKKKIGGSFMSPDFAFLKLQKAKIANLNAIPGTPRTSTQTGNGGTPTGPASTPEIEMITQAGDVLITQTGDNLITN
jgi:hypothetical protein